MKDRARAIATFAAKDHGLFATMHGGLTLDNDQNLRSAHQFGDFGNAEILAVGHGEPITRDAASQLREILK